MQDSGSDNKIFRFYNFLTFESHCINIRYFIAFFIANTIECLL